MRKVWTHVLLAGSLVFSLMFGTPLGSASAENDSQTAEQVAKVALERYRAKEFQVAARMYLQVYALSSSASALWNAGKAFRAAANNALESGDKAKSLGYRKEGLNAWNTLLKNHKLPAKRLARALEQMERLKIQIADEEKAIAAATVPGASTQISTAAAPPPPPLLRPSPAKVEVVAEAPSKVGAWTTLGSGVLLGLGSGLLFAMTQGDLAELEEKLKVDPATGLIPPEHRRDELLAEEYRISKRRNISLGLAITAGVAAVVGGVWMMSGPEVTASVSSSGTSGQVSVSGHF